MAELKAEYTDVRGRTHTVEHATVPPEDGDARERILEKLVEVLAAAGS